MKMRLFVLWLLITSLTIWATVSVVKAQGHVGATYTVVAGCELKSDPQLNNQPQIVYFACDNSVAFMLHSESPGGLRLHEINGHVLDVKVTVVK